MTDPTAGLAKSGGSKAVKAAPFRFLLVTPFACGGNNALLRNESLEVAPALFVGPSTHEFTRCLDGYEAGSEILPSMMSIWAKHTVPWFLCFVGLSKIPKRYGSFGFRPVKLGREGDGSLPYGSSGS